MKTSHMLKRLFVMIGTSATFAAVPLTAVHADDMSAIPSDDLIMHEQVIFSMDQMKNMANEMLNHKIDLLNQLLNWTNNRSMLSWNDKRAWYQKVQMWIWKVNEMKQKINVKDKDIQATRADYLIIKSMNGRNMNMIMNQRMFQ